MNTKKKIAVRKLLSGVLVLLGFTACDSDGPGNELCEWKKCQRKRVAISRKIC